MIAMRRGRGEVVDSLIRGATLAGGRRRIKRVVSGVSSRAGGNCVEGRGTPDRVDGRAADSHGGPWKRPVYFQVTAIAKKWSKTSRFGWLTFNGLPSPQRMRYAKLAAG